jgi:sugar phosphate permease
MFISGSLGDRYSPKWLLVIGYTIITAICILIGMACEMNWGVVAICVLFAFNGLVQSIGWPSSFVVFSNWFGKKGRGTIVGLWSSSSNLGNVIGSFLTSIFLETA